MKRVLTGIMTMVLAASLCAATAFAAGPGCGRYFVDADGDGLCDVCGVAHARYGGGNFVDADGDGVCDNFQSGQGRGCGYGRGGQGGRGRGCHSGRNQ